MPPQNHYIEESQVANEIDRIDRKITTEMDAAHCHTVDEVLEYFQVSSSEGLSDERIEKAREKFGLNGMTLS